MMYTRVLQEGRRRECQMEYVARKASTMRGALLALALLSAACGHVVKSGPPEPQAPTTLKVRNQNFLDPPWRFTPPVKLDFRRRSGALGATGDVLANAVPIPRETTHFGDPDVSPTLPSMVTASAPNRRVAPPARTRLSACVESDCPTSMPRETSARQF